MEKQLDDQTPLRFRREIVIRTLDERTEEKKIVIDQRRGDVELMMFEVLLQMIEDLLGDGIGQRS